MPSSTITSLGIPTRNRPECLKRCVESYARNAQAHGRQIEITISDDSRDEATQAANKEVLRSIGPMEGVRLYYADRSRRSAFARELAAAAGVPEEVATYALLGDERCALTYGANRNSLLLHAVGELTVQVDDDTICDIVRHPEYKEGLIVADEEIERAYWFDRKRDVSKKVEVDFFALHETLLGKKPVDCMAAYTTPKYLFDAKYMTETLRNQINNEQAKIYTTHLGFMGDSGWGSNLSVLLAHRESLLRLVHDKSTYKKKLASRQIWNGSPRSCVSRVGSGQTINMGVDNRTSFAPFVPVGVNEDGIFSQFLLEFVPGSFKGALPYLIQHVPPGARRYDPETVIGPPFMNGLLTIVFRSLKEHLNAAIPEENIYILGSLLKEMTRMPAREFEDYVLWTGQQDLKKFYALLEKRLEMELIAPSYWKEDVSLLMDSIKEHLSDKDFLAPYDLNGTFEEKLSQYRELLSQLGMLLVHWSALFQTAKEIKEQGQRLALPL